MTTRSGLGCGACSVCCTLLHVPDIGKPALMPCWHTSMHGGCAVQAEKATDPKLMACAQFKCVWLASQDMDEPLPRSMRPDQTYVLMGPQDRDDDTLLYVHVDPKHQDAWRSGQIDQFLRSRVALGAKLCVVIGERKVYLPEEDGSYALDALGAA